MAKQVADLVINLGIQGDQDLSRLSGQFRELGRAVNLSGGQIDNLRQRILSYNSDGQRSEQLIRGQVDALKALQRQAEIGGTAWQQINSNIRDLERSARLSNGAIEQLGRTVMAEAAAHGQSAASLREHIRSLERLRDQATINSQTTRTLSESIGQLRERLDTASDASRRHFSSLTQALGVRPDAVLRQWQAYRDVLNDSRATAEQLATAQQRLRQLGGAPFISQRRAVAEQAAMVADPEYQRRFGVQADTLNEVPLPNTTAGLTQRLQELQFQLANTERGTAAYVQTALAMATVQRDLSATTQGLGQALVEQLAAGRAASSLRNLRAAVAQLNGEMQELDLTTSEGSAEYARLATQSRQLQQQLDHLARSYTNVADAANQAAAAQSSAASRAVTANYLNRAQVRQQEAAFANAAATALRQAQATPLMLPAAGQTSAPGTGMNISGGARYGYPSPNLAPLVQLPGPTGSTARERSAAYRQGLAAPGPSAADAAASDEARRAYISETAALRAKTEAEAAAKERLRELRQNVETLNKSNGDSIEKLQRLRQSWTELRDAVRMTSASYKNAQTQIEAIDRRLERANRPRRPTGMQLAQAGGAAISGGIFGGFEGFAGGAIGGIIGAGTPAGPVGGAFAGAAIGAQVGMIRQQIGETATYAAEIRRLQTALSGVVGSFEDYRTAIRTTEQVADRFNLPLRESTQRFTQLSAAVIGSGGTIAQARESFNNITAAIIATGGSTEQVNAALTATAQVFSKGKVTAEELRGQLGERLPGAFATFADSMGVSTQQLDKLLDEGKVTIPDFLRFVNRLGKEYGDTADRMARSSEQAGARMTRAFEDLRITVGDALSPTGATFQDTITSMVRSLDRLIEKMMQLKLITPGPTFFIDQVLSGQTSVEDLERRVLEGGQRETARRSNSWLPPFISNFITRKTNPGELEELKAMEEALIRIRRLYADIDKSKKEDKAAERQREQEAEADRKAKEREQRAKQYLDAIQQREESLLDARQDREEQLAEIRKNSLREAEQLERRFADERRQIEREVRDIRTQRADTAEDNERRLRIARGEDESVVNAAQRVADIYRKERDDNQAMADRIADAERTQAQTIADFQRKTAEDINKANEAYAKRVGEIQRNYAVTTRRILEEGSKQQGLKLIAAGRIVALEQERIRLNDLRKRGGVATIPEPTGSVGGVPAYPGTSAVDAAGTVFPRLDAELQKLRRQLGSISVPSAASITPSPSTPAPNLGRAPALPGAAQTSASRATLEAANRAANAQTAREETQLAFAENYRSLQEGLTALKRQRVEQQLQLQFQERGFSEQLSRSLASLRQDANAAFVGLSATYDRTLEEIAKKRREDKKYTEEQANRDRETARELRYESGREVQQTYDNMRGITIELERQNELLRFRQDERLGLGATEGLREYIATMGTAREASKQLALTGIKGIENAIVDLATTGTTNFREFANSMIQDTIRMITQQLILRTVLSLFNLGQPAAAAAAPGAFKMPTSVIPQKAQGGIADGPMSGYPAILHGTEAVIPLTASRTIPVQLTGGSGPGAAPIININVDATGTAVQGDQGSSRELARDLAAVVDDRLVYHRRRGGLLDMQR